MSIKASLTWVSIWILSALIFTGVIFRFFDPRYGIEFLTCYAIEWTLSVDNLFVFLMIFRAFGVEGHRQVRALKWGIIGAMVLRLVFILIGVALVNLFEPILYFFGALLIYSAVRMVRDSGERQDVGNNRLVKFVRRRFSVTKKYYGEKFFIRRGHAIIATPMFLVLIAIESSDVMFAIDSIPAAFAISREPWIIFSANMFAIFGLRALYFLLVHADKLFKYLKIGVSFVLAFVGLKMLTHEIFHVNEYVSLAVVLSSLAISIAASMLIKPKMEKSDNT